MKETKLNPEIKQRFSALWDSGRFDGRYDAIRNIVDNRPEALDEMDVQALKGILSDMDSYRQAQAAGEIA